MAKKPGKTNSIPRACLMESLAQFGHALVGGDIKIEWGNHAPHAVVEERVIRLPTPPEKVDEDTATLTRAFVDHECAHILHTEPNCMKGLTHEERWLLNAIEDGRINQLIGQRYRGCGQNIARAYEILKERAEQDGSEDAVPERVKAISALGRMAGGLDKENALRYASAGKEARRLVDAVERVWRRFETLDSTTVTREAAQEIHAIWGEEGALQSVEVIAEGMRLDRRLEEDKDALPKIDDLKKLVLLPGLAGGFDDDVTDLLREKFEALHRELGETPTSHPEEDGAETPDCGEEYLADRTHDVIRIVPCSARADTESFHREVRSLVGQLARRLYRDLLGRGPTWRRHRRSGHGIDHRVLYRVALDDPRIFRKRCRTQRVDAALTLLVDFSGSMKGGRIHLALQLAMAFAEACDVIGVPSEVLGFTTTESESTTPERWKPPRGQTLRAIPLHHLVIQPFGRRFRAVRHAFLQALHDTALKQNVDGEAVLWAGERLAARPEQHRHLIVLSDGYPEAPLEGGSYRVLRSHLKQAVEEIERRGIQVVGIGIQSRAVQRFYPRHVVVQSLDDLVTSGYEVISRILRGSRGIG